MNFQFLALFAAVSILSLPVRANVELTSAPAGPTLPHEQPAPDEPFTPSNWSIHAQATLIPQWHGYFTSPYEGPNSLLGNPELDASFTSTLFLGKKLWKGAEIYFNPEAFGGNGLSHTHGVAGFPNGEIYRVDTPDPKLGLARLYLKQVLGFGGPEEDILDGQNQIATHEDISRLTVAVGRFSLNDFFDNNAYSHDPRTQFLNWSLMDNGAWDYAADTRGYTWGVYLEFNQANWAVRFASALEPSVANGMDYDFNLAQAQGNNLEFEYRYRVGSHPGVARLLGYANNAHMGSYAMALGSPTPDITRSEAYRTKYGFGLNLEQEITPILGVFSRLGWNNGETESWAFTEVDDTVSFGASLKGGLWTRSDDTLGLALVVNGLSHDHAAYLAAGGMGFILGDGRLDYAPEEILETYYNFVVYKFFAVAADFQEVIDPGYNRDRGPVSIYAIRVHCEL